MTTNFTNILDHARRWVIDVHPGQSEHLLQTEYWLNQIAPDAPFSVQLAALTHDMERAFPGDDAPNPALATRPTDTVYNLAHGKRSAKFVSEWLREQRINSELIEIISDLIVVHEYGGWPEASLVQAADSLSFLEVNTDKFIGWIPTAQFGWGKEKTVTKFEWMYQRITVPAAQKLAIPLFDTAMKKIEEAVREIQ
ncbi:MAG: HD domain-containing protein [Chloroflexota bacterium]